MSKRKPYTILYWKDRESGLFYCDFQHSVDEVLRDKALGRFIITDFYIGPAKHLRELVAALKNGSRWNWSNNPLTFKELEGPPYTYSKPPRSLYFE